jgi:hypothetical protein
VTAKRFTIALACGISLLLWSTVGAAGAHRPLVVNVVLAKDRAAAGTPIHATAVFTNRTSHQIMVETCAADGWLEVGLKSATYRPQFAHPSPACPPSVRLKPGVNRFPVMILTTYDGCLEPTGQSVVRMPHCLAGNRLPPLPTGRYVTSVSILGLDNLVKVARPATVMLVKAPSTR